MSRSEVISECVEAIYKVIEDSKMITGGPDDHQATRTSERNGMLYAIITLKGLQIKAMESELLGL